MTSTAHHQLQADLDRQKAQNDALLRILRSMERMRLSDKAKAAVQYLISQAMATQAVLEDCAKRLEGIPDDPE